LTGAWHAYGRASGETRSLKCLAEILHLTFGF
jgi:hypothetical protein